MGPLVATRVMANIPDIPIIIQISWSLWFQKSMTLDVCPDIPANPEIPDIAELIIYPLGSHDQISYFSKFLSSKFKKFHN